MILLYDISNDGCSYLWMIQFWPNKVSFWCNHFSLRKRGNRGRTLSLTCWKAEAVFAPEMRIVEKRFGCLLYEHKSKGMAAGRQTKLFDGTLAQQYGKRRHRRSFFANKIRQGQCYNCMCVNFCSNVAKCTIFLKHSDLTKFLYL